MKKFLVLYRAPTTSFDQMKNATPEQMKAGMDAWMAWAKKTSEATIDFGAPLGKSQMVKPGEQPAEHRNDLGGYSILQGESKEAIAKLMDGHPHFQTPGGTIEVIEILPVPGAS